MIGLKVSMETIYQSLLALANDNRRLEDLSCHSVSHKIVEWRLEVVRVKTVYYAELSLTDAIPIKCLVQPPSPSRESARSDGRLGRKGKKETNKTKQ